LEKASSDFALSGCGESFEKKASSDKSDQSVWAEGETRLEQAYVAAGVGFRILALPRHAHPVIHLTVSLASIFFGLPPGEVAERSKAALC
jgi:hypothetical protein